MDIVPFDLIVQRMRGHYENALFQMIKCHLYLQLKYSISGSKKSHIKELIYIFWNKHVYMLYLYRAYGPHLTCLKSNSLHL